MPQAQTNKVDVPRELFRAAEVVRDTLNEDDRTVELSFSSETDEVVRWFGKEILGHKDGEIDLSRFNGGAAPLCIDHRVSIADGQIGTIQKAWVKGKKAHALVRFGLSPRAKEIMERVKDGEITNVSVGYRVLEMLLIKKGEGDEPNIYRVTKWIPREISFVSIPADSSVGVGREDSTETISVPVKENNMPKPKENDDNRSDNQAAAPVPAAPKDDRQQVDETAVRQDERNSERSRISAITRIAGEFKIEASVRDAAIESGKSEDDFRKDVLEEIKKRSADDEPAGAQRGDIGLTEREVSQYSFRKALVAQLNPGNARAQEDAAFELECSAAAEEKRGNPGQGWIVPHEVLRAPIAALAGIGHNSRAMTVGTAAEAGNLVATNLAPSFIDLLYNRMAVMAMGATRFNDLTGNVDFSKFISGASGYWVGEGVDVSESTPGTGLVSLRPNTVGGFVELTRRTLLQSSMDIEAWVRGNLAKAIALQIDAKALYGDGTNDTPNGVASASGIGAVSHGTDGGAPTWATTVQFETEVAVDNADIGSLGYITNSQVRGKLKTTKKDAGSGIFLMGDKRMENGMAVLNGYPCAISNQVVSNGTKGTGTNLSGQFFGNWSDLYLGFWSGLDLLANPYAKDKAGTVRITGLQDVDSVVARAESFSYAADIVTT